MPTGIVFDLDDTLYLERDYVASGFDRVARELERRGFASRTTIYDFLWQNFLEGVRGDSFERLLLAFPALSCESSELVELYRSHFPALRLDSEAAQLLSALRARGVRTGIITDGPVPTQTAKVQALGLEGLVDRIIITDSYGIEGRKPNPRSFIDIAGHLSLPAESLTYVGDNPVKDFLAPRSLGWRTIRLRRPLQLHFGVEPVSEDYAADREIGLLSELLSLGVGS